jgi:2Fe-2S ferredoxin
VRKLGSRSYCIQNLPVYGNIAIIPVVLYTLPTIKFIDKNGNLHEVDAPTGRSLMLVGLEADVAGIDAECGGCCSCATCHVYLDEQGATQVPEPGPVEADLLDFVAAPRLPTSRLSCQITVTEAMHDLIVRVAPVQT